VYALRKKKGFEDPKRLLEPQRYLVEKPNNQTTNEAPNPILYAP